MNEGEFQGLEKGFLSTRVFKTRMNPDFTLPECLPKIVTLVSMSGFSNDLFETNFSTS